MQTTASPHHWALSRDQWPYQNQELEPLPSVPRPPPPPTLESRLPLGSPYVICQPGQFMVLGWVSKPKMAGATGKNEPLLCLGPGGGEGLWGHLLLDHSMSHPFRPRHKCRKLPFYGTIFSHRGKARHTQALFTASAFRVGSCKNQQASAPG